MEGKIMSKDFRRKRPSISTTTKASNSEISRKKLRKCESERNESQNNSEITRKNDIRSTEALKSLFGEHDENIESYDEETFLPEPAKKCSDFVSGSNYGNSSVSQEIKQVEKGGSNIDSSQSKPNFNAHEEQDEHENRSSPFKLPNANQDNILKEMENMQQESERRIITKMEALISPILNQISVAVSEIRDAKDLCKAILSSKGSQSTNLSKISLKSKYDEELTNFSTYFSEKIISKVMEAVLIRFLGMGSSNCNTKISIMKATDVFTVPFSAVLFGKRANQNKSTWLSGVGLEASKFRKMIVISSLKNVQGNRFNHFENGSPFESTVECPKGPESQESRSKNISSSKEVSVETKSKIPYWLKSTTEKHVEKARKMKETKAPTKQKPSVGKNLSDGDKLNIEEICVRAAERLFSDVTTVLHNGRGRGRLTIYEEIGYALSAWKLSKDEQICNMKQPSISFLQPSSAAKIISFDSIPLTNFNSVIKNNEGIYKEFLKRCDNMILSIVHDVRIIKVLPSSKYGQQECSGIDMGSDSGEDHTPVGKDCNFRRLNRIVNLVDVSLNFLSSYSGVDLKNSLEERLERHEMIIRASYKLAVVLREIVVSYLRSLSRLETDEIISEEEWEKIVRFKEISLAELKSSPSHQSRAFSKMVTSISPETFNALNVSHKGFPEDGNDEEDGKERNEDEEVDEDGNLCFVLI